MGAERPGALRLVPPREAIDRWFHFEPLITRVLDRVQGGQWSDDVLTCVQLGSMHLWDIRDGEAVCITELQNFPRYRQLLIYMVAGEHARDWIASGDRQLTDFAKLHRCKYVVFHGRPGWERYAKRFGYDSKLIIMRKEV